MKKRYVNDCGHTNDLPTITLNADKTQKGGRNDGQRSRDIEKGPPGRRKRGIWREMV